jgi:hypothetical protein
MKLATLTVFGAGYVLGSKAGRQRYEQIMDMARRASQGLEDSRAQERLQVYAARLEAYGREHGVSRDEVSRASRTT